MRYIITLRGNINKRENTNDRNDAVAIAKRWRATYDGVVTIKDNATGKTETYQSKGAGDPLQSRKYYITREPHLSSEKCKKNAQNFIPFFVHFFIKKI